MNTSSKQLSCLCTGCAAKDEAKPGVYVIFDTFNDEVGRDDHMKGAAAKELAANAEKLFSLAPKVHRVQVVAEK